MKTTKLLRKFIKIKNGKKRKFVVLNCKDCKKDFERREDYYKLNLNGSCRLCKLLSHSFKHGLSGDKHYDRYKHMMSRCYNKDDKAYVNYGGRGIVVCKEWKNDIRIFINWCNENYKHGKSLDRKDNDDGYSPGNCRFVTNTTQSRNQRVIKKSNLSGYKGVYLLNKTNKYIVSISLKTNDKINLGYVDNKYDGGVLYNTFVKKNGLDHTVNHLTNLIILTVPMFINIKLPAGVKHTKSYKKDLYVLEGLLTKILNNSTLGKNFGSVLDKYVTSLTRLRDECSSLKNKFKLDNKHIVVERFIGKTIIINTTDKNKPSPRLN